MAFPPLGNSDHVVSVCIDFAVNSKQDTPFHRLTYGYSHANWDGLCDHLRDVPCEDIFNLVNFVSGFKLELVYISLIVGIRSTLNHLQDFQLLVWLP